MNHELGVEMPTERERENKKEKTYKHKREAVGNSRKEGAILGKNDFFEAIRGSIKSFFLSGLLEKMEKFEESADRPQSATGKKDNHNRPNGF
jgi:hypothetical protein